MTATPSKSDAERGRKIAEFLLDAAAAWNVKIGINDVEVVTFSQGVPPRVIHWLERELLKYRREVFNFVQQKNGGR